MEGRLLFNFKANYTILYQSRKKVYITGGDEKCNIKSKYNFGRGSILLDELNKYFPEINVSGIHVSSQQNEHLDKDRISV